MAGRFRRILIIGGATLAFAALALALGTLVPRPLWPQEPMADAGRHRVMVLMNPIHTDIAIPLEPAVRSAFAFLGDAGQPIDAPGARYLVIGWGGREFYTQTPSWSQLKLAPLLKGLTLDRAVMHVDIAGEIPEPHPQVFGIYLDDAAFSAVVDRIRQSFASAGAGPIHVSGFSYGAHDAFYEANGSFTALFGCNTWTASVLRAGGLRTGWWNPLPETLAVSLRLFNESEPKTD